MMGSAISRLSIAQVANSLELQNCHSELHIFPAGDPEDAQPEASQVKRAPSPSALAPGEWPPQSGPKRKGRVMG